MVCEIDCQRMELMRIPEYETLAYKAYTTHELLPPPWNNNIQPWTLPSCYNGNHYIVWYNKKSQLGDEKQGWDYNFCQIVQAVNEVKFRKKQRTKLT